ASTPVNTAARPPSSSSQPWAPSPSQPSEPLQRYLRSSKIPKAVTTAHPPEPHRTPLNRTVPVCTASSSISSCVHRLSPSFLFLNALGTPSLAALSSCLSMSLTTTATIWPALKLNAQGGAQSPSLVTAPHPPEPHSTSLGAPSLAALSICLSMSLTTTAVLLDFLLSIPPPSIPPPSLPPPSLPPPAPQFSSVKSTVASPIKSSPSSPASPHSLSSPPPTSSASRFPRPTLSRASSRLCLLFPTPLLFPALLFPFPPSAPSPVASTSALSLVLPFSVEVFFPATPFFADLVVFFGFFLVPGGRRRRLVGLVMQVG
ncbi:unnamed protein product, partial [Closterium sp. NIES-54]